MLYYGLRKAVNINGMITKTNYFYTLIYKAGATFDNSFFDNCFVFLQQLKNRSFSDTFTVHKKVKIRINRT